MTPGSTVVAKWNENVTFMSLVKEILENYLLE